MASRPKTLAARIIAESDIKSERLISMLRMALASLLFFGVAFLLLRSEALGLDSRRFELVWLLGGAIAYFCLGALNYYAAAASRFRPWMSWAFNLGEVALVSFQLYIDVADPETPSLLVFASPALLVAALVICVQVLRFKVGLHAVSSAILLALCGLILLHDPQLGQPLAPEALNELQVVYKLPPNIMRLIMLSAMAVLIGTAVYRSRKLIETVARETELAENRKRFLPDEISDSMSDENIEALRQGEERDVAVLFADIRGFTAMSEKIGARESAEFLGRYRSLVTDAAVSNSGIVDKFVGDGAFVVFGVHSDIGQASHDAVEAASKLQAAIESWNEGREARGLEDVKVAIAVHAGPAIIGAIGDDRRLEFTAIGNTINLASRLEQIAKQEGRSLVVSRSTLKAAGLGEEGFASLGPMQLRGSSEPIHVMAQ